MFKFIRLHKYKIALTISATSLGTFIRYDDKYDKKYKYSDIEKHNNEKSGIWVTYKNEVYDITEFVTNHPGGKDKIMLAAGKAIDPYWNKYKQHTNDTNIVKTILSPMKIGILTDYDEEKYTNFVNPYIDDPIRDPNLIFHSSEPCNAELPHSFITDNWITPNNLWYIRNHHPVPKVDIKNYCLKIKDKCIGLEELKKKFPKKSIIATIQCGGNRRSEYNKIEKTLGTPWSIGAISTAKWSGILLKDFLEYYGIDDQIKHIEFESIDSLKASIPIEKALNPFGDVILAYEMNDEEIPRDHGYPLRAIVPGYVGIRNVKWLKTISLREEESEGNWQRGLSYKRLPSSIKTNIKKVDLTKIPTTNELPVQSLITCIDNSVIKGIAYSGGGRGIIRVEVSLDNGKNWYIADLKDGSNQNPYKSWAWTFWEFPIKNNINNKLIICRATDISYNVQPENLTDIWNIRGLINNSWYKFLL
jgi:sulfite oxidase